MQVRLTATPTNVLTEISSVLLILLLYYELLFSLFLASSMVIYPEILLVVLVAESDLLDRIKKNKVSKALFLIQKALLVYNMEPNKSSKTKILLEVVLTFTLY